MILLAIDTSRQSGEIALFDKGNKKYLSIPNQKRHSEFLLSELEQFLYDNKISLNDVSVLACVTGPGSFTGIRVGMATVKAFSFALNLNIVSDNFFNIIAGKIKNGLVAIKNTTNTVFLASISNFKVKNINVVENEKIEDMVNGDILYVMENEQIPCIPTYKNLSIIKDFNKIMLDYFVRKAENGDFTNKNDFTPFYAQLSQAEKMLEDKDEN